MRYLPLTDADRSAMLDVIGVSSIDDLFADVPEAARLSGPIADLPNHASELAVERHMAALAAARVDPFLPWAYLRSLRHPDYLPARPVTGARPRAAAISVPRS